MATNGPLTDDDRAVLDTSLAALADAKAQIKLAKLAGIDVADMENEANRLEAQIRAIKSAYFPTK